MTKQVIYRERSGGQDKYSTYSDYQRYQLSKRRAMRLIRNGKARLVICD